MKQLIVNADDYARSPEVSAGILQSHLQGIVTTTTILVNLPDAQRAVENAHELAPDLAIGIHLNLTLGKPCKPFSKSLINKHGTFYSIEQWSTDPDLVPLDEIETQWRLQIEQLQRYGVTIDHMDSHHHIAAMREDIWELYLDLASELECGVRPPYPGDIPEQVLIQSFPESLVSTARTKALPMMAKRKIPHPATFLGSFFDEQATLDHLHTLLSNLPEGVSELMCHPGFNSPSLEQTSGYALQRESELEILTHQATTRTIRNLGIELMTYRSVWP
jgi:predicted glycoside hydrolase/deacetylase ChbG (UPF0249 family)